jgi:hypothetical protein
LLHIYIWTYISRKLCKIYRVCDIRLDPPLGVHLVEKHVHVNIGCVKDIEPGWYLDTGANNNMTRQCAAPLNWATTMCFH